jgi:hypothetical protein
MKSPATFVKVLSVCLLVLAFVGIYSIQASAETKQSDSVGIEGTVSSDPPSQAPTIDIPSNGQGFSNIPITIAGRCTNGLLVEVFRNNVFAGSVTCTNGSYSIKIDLFSGKNDLVARQYDSLNQVSPDSNTISVNFNDALPGTGPRVSITTVYAKRGADPNTKLTWPLTISGGTSPYAISVDWGDKTAPDLISRQNGGDFNIEHTCTQPGIYNVTVKVTDGTGSTAFLQLVSVCNGEIQQSTSSGNGAGPTVITKKELGLAFWITVAVAIPLLAVTFWLGTQHQLQVIRDKLRRGEPPL